ncbi:MAG: hypothetical protein AAF551_09925 [Bacteroidota bacterium]
MKSIYLKSTLLVLLIVSFAACEDDNEPLPELTDGTIVFMAPPDNCNDYVIAIDGSNTLLKPNNLADSLKVDSLKIKFDFDSTALLHNCNFGGQIPVISIGTIEVIKPGVCPDKIKLSAEKYAGSTGFYTIVSASVSGDCLEITYSSSGCDGSSWVTEVVDSEQVAESIPPQRRVKLLLENKELCQAVFTKSVYVDLSPIRVSAANEITLSVEGFEGPISYRY